MKLHWGLSLVLLCLIHTSCIKKLNLYQGDKDDEHRLPEASDGTCRELRETI